MEDDIKLTRVYIQYNVDVDSHLNLAFSRCCPGVHLIKLSRGQGFLRTHLDKSFFIIKNVSDFFLLCRLSVSDLEHRFTCFSH